VLLDEDDRGVAAYDIENGNAHVQFPTLMKIQVESSVHIKMML
jgi:hypothetical protein